MIQLSIDFLLLVILVLLLILCIFTLYIFFQRQRESYFNYRRDTYIKNNSQLWYDYLLHDEHFSITLVPRGRPQVEGVETIFLSYLKNISNVKIEQIIRNFSNLYLRKYYEKDLASKRWSIRMNALYRITDFQMDELIDTCRKLDEKNISEEEYFQLLKIYSLFQPGLFMEKIRSFKVSYSGSEYRRLFVLLEEDVFIRFFDNFDMWPASIQFAVIDTAAVKRSMKYINRLELLLTHETDEIRIRALKGLFEIGLIEDINIYVPFVTSEIWEERLMIAKIFKYIPLSYTYSYLEQLLQDEKWWVRSQAAQTIAEQQDGVEKLKQFIASSEDNYAIDIAQEIVMRRQGLLWK